MSLPRFEPTHTFIKLFKIWFRIYYAFRTVLELVNILYDQLLHH